MENEIKNLSNICFTIVRRIESGSRVNLDQLSTASEVDLKHMSSMSKKKDMSQKISKFQELLNKAIPLASRIPLSSNMLDQKTKLRAELLTKLYNAYNSTSTNI